MNTNFENFDDMTVAQMAAAYNEVAPVVGVNPIKKFENRETALRRLTKILADAKAQEALTVEPEVEAPQPEVETAPVPVQLSVEEARKLATQQVKQGKQRRKRQKVFNYPPAEEQKELKEGSLRYVALQALKRGATYAEIEQIVREFDIALGKKPDRRISGRAYGLIRLLHTFVGYGLRERLNEDGEKLIFAITNKQVKDFQSSK